MSAVEGSTVLVTGANGGLGRQLVTQALHRGARRVYATARHPQLWPDARVVPLELDVADHASVERVAREALDTTILINNAGISDPTPLLQSTLAEVRAMFETNVFGPLALIQEFAPILAANGRGAIVDIHSARSWLAGPGAYSASKAALWALTNSLRLELAGQGTQVVGVHFAFADTAMTKRYNGVEKADPADIVDAIYNGLEAGDLEVIADELTRSYKAQLSLPLRDQYPNLP